MALNVINRRKRRKLILGKNIHCIMKEMYIWPKQYVAHFGGSISERRKIGCIQWHLKDIVSRRFMPIPATVYLYVLSDIRRNAITLSTLKNHPPIPRRHSRKKDGNES